MEETIIAAKTVTATGLVEYLNKVKEAEKEGYKAEEQPVMNGNIITQVMVKYKQELEYK